MGDDVTLPTVARHRLYQMFSTITFRTSDFMACVKKRHNIIKCFTKKMYKARRYEGDILNKEIIWFALFLSTSFVLLLQQSVSSNKKKDIRNLCVDEPTRCTDYYK